MFLGEMRKLFGKRILQVLFLVLLVGNGVLNYINETTNVQATDADASAYAALQRDLSGLSDAEKTAYIEAGIDDLLIMQDIQINVLMGMDDEEVPERYASGAYLHYTGNLFAEKALYKEVQEELALCTGYPAYVQSTLDKTLSALKKLDDHDSYQFQNLAAIYLAFDGVKDVQTSYGSVRGVRMLLENQTTDLWIMLFLFMCCIMIISVEREKNLLILAKTTMNGRGRLGFYKLLILYICCVLAMLLHLENLLLAAKMYGFGNLSRSIQSVAGYQGCTLRVSVGGFIGLVYGGKLLFYFLCVTFVYLVCCNSLRSVWVYLVTVCTAAVCAYMYFGISNTSWLVTIKLLSPIGLLCMNEVFGVYRNLRIGTLAVSRMYMSLIILAVLLLVCAVAAVLVFAKTKERETEKMNLRIPAFERLRLRMECHTGRLRHEAYKVFFSQHALLVLLAFAAIVGVTFQPRSVQGESGEAYYKEYVTAVCGPSELVEDDYWEAQIAVVLRAYEDASVKDSVSRMSSLNQMEQALTRVASYAAYLGEKEGSWYLYEAKFRLVMGDADTLSADLESALLLIVVCVFCYTGMYAMDYQNDGIRLLKSTKYGRGRLTKNKLLIGVGIGAVVYALVWLPHLYRLLVQCQAEELSAPAYSLELLSWMGKGVSVGAALALLVAVRVLGVLALLLLTCAVTTCFGSFIVSGCVTLGVTAIPVLLAFLGVDFMRYALLTPLILGTVCLEGWAALAAGLLQGALIMALSALRLKRGL